ncbi:MAG TPA: glycosyltransferase family 4 protein [Ignavibacteriaceae bacterium]|nr:glycosyltransferase family 4 protein [Ignavibacteriaceae bacterium]
MYKVIYIDRITEHSANIPSNIKDGDNYFTIGWGAGSARKFKEFNPQVTVECWKTDYKSDKIYERELYGVKFIIFPAFHIKQLGDYSFSLLKHLKKELRKKENEIFHITSFRHLLFYSVASKLKKVPVVVQNNGESSAIYKVKISKGFKKFFYFLQLPWERRAFKYIDLLYILDERLKAYLPETRAEIKKQTLGIMPERFSPLDKKTARQLLDLDPEKKYLLYIGKLNPTKSPDILIDIFKDIKKDRDDVELLIAGTNNNDPLINYALDAGAKVFGRIMHTDIYKYLSAADVYILPKYSIEHIFGGIGLLPVEALLCNTPIIGGSLENFPQDCKDSVGFAVNDRDEMKVAIIKILDKKIAFHNLRKIAIENYSWEKISKDTSIDYKKILDKYFG